MMPLTDVQASIVAQEARDFGKYGEITIHHAEGYGYFVTGRMVINGQGIGRTWTDYGDLAGRNTPCGGDTCDMPIGGRGKRAPRLV